MIFLLNTVGDLPFSEFSTVVTIICWQTQNTYYKVRDSTKDETVYADEIKIFLT